MDIINLENSLININFVLLFLAMILYWLKSAFFFKQKLNFLPDTILICSSLLQFFFLCLRWINSNHFPLSNLYESLVFLSYSLTNLLIVLNFNFIKINLLQNKSSKKNKIFFNSFIGSILTPLILLVNTFASFSLPTDLKLSNALVPALQSNWLLMHVTVMILSYATLLCGCLFSISYLILISFNFVTFNSEKIKIQINNNLKKITNSKYLDLQNIPWQNDWKEIGKKIENHNQIISNRLVVKNNLQQLLKTLDNLSYRIIGLGFPLLTIGILSGAVWANQTWGSYWNWDPKETWALITWFIFAIYLHTRLSKGWTGLNSSLLASFGFIIIWVCYLGVNLMGKGLHSYGFLST